MSNSLRDYIGSASRINDRTCSPDSYKHDHRQTSSFYPDPTKGFPRDMYTVSQTASNPTYRASYGSGHDPYRERLRVDAAAGRVPRDSDFIKRRDEYKSYEPLVGKARRSYEDYRKTQPNQSLARQQGLPGKPYASKEWHDKGAMLGTKAANAYNAEASGRWGMHERYIGYEEKAGWNGHQERYNSLRDGERKYRSFAKNHENLSR